MKLDPLPYRGEKERLEVVDGHLVRPGECRKQFIRPLRIEDRLAVGEGKPVEDYVIGTTPLDACDHPHILIVDCIQRGRFPVNRPFVFNPYFFIERGKLEISVYLPELHQIGFPRSHRNGSDFEGHVETQCCKELAHVSPILVVEQFLPDRRFSDLLDPGIYVIDRAEARHELTGRLIANAGDAGDIVGGVAREGEKIRNEAGIDAELRRYFLPPHVDVFHAVVDGDGITGELHEVLITRDHDGFCPFGLKPADACGDDIVGLEAFLLEARYAHCLDDSLHIGELKAEVSGHGRSRRFVFLGYLCPECGPPGIPDDHERFGFALTYQLLQHVDESVDGIRRHSFGVGKIGGGEISPIHEGIAVN